MVDQDTVEFYQELMPKQIKLAAGNAGRQAAKAGESRLMPDGWEQIPHYEAAWYRAFDRQVERDAAQMMEVHYPESSTESEAE